MSGAATSLRLAYLNYNKLCRPTARPSIQRARLLCRLSVLSDSKLALLRAEAGYGKTTLLLDSLRNWPHPTVWYRLDRTDQDVAQFAAYLAEGISQHFPDSGAEIRKRIGSEATAATALELWHLLLHEISILPARPLLIVLDNFEAVAASPQVCALVSDLLEYSGQELHIAIASRSVPPLRIARLEARQDVVTLGPEDLAFTGEESREFLVGLHAVGVTAAQQHILWQRTQGWPAGLAMIAEVLHQSSIDEVVRGLQEDRSTPDMIYRYFAEEVFEDQNTELREFLVKTSILTSLSHDIVNDLLEVENGGELLDSLRRAGTFVLGMEAGDGALRYHPLFRSFLLQKLHARLGDDQIRSLYRRAAQAASRYRLWNDAIDYRAAVEDWEEVGEIVESIGEELTRRGLLETFRYLLDRVPEEQIDRRPALLMLRGRLLRQAGRYHEALRDLDRAHQGFEQGGDRGAVVLAEHEIGSTHYYLGEFQRAEAVLSAALRGVGSDAVLRGWILADLARNCIGSDDLEEGERWGEMAMTASMSATPGRARTIALIRALRFHGQAVLLRGKLQEGLRDIARSVDLCRREDVGDLQLAWSLFVLGQGLALQGSFDNACRILDEAETLAHGSRPLLNWIWAWRGTANRDLGTFERAEHDLQRARDAAQRELAFLRLRQDRPTEGLQLAQEAFRNSLSAESLGERAACQAVYGIALARSQDRQAGLQQLAAAAEIFRQRGRQHQLASVQWHLARVLLEEDRRAEALALLEKAVLWGWAAGVYHLWWWDSETIARLWSLALSAGWAPAYLLELARQRLGPEDYSLLYEALEMVAPALRPQVTDALRAVSRSSVVHNVTTDLLQSCRDRAARRHIGEAISAGLLDPHDLACLRESAGLTWKEIEILTFYYLRPVEEGEGSRFRQRLAQALALSEHTLKAHIRNIRRKLHLPDRRRGPYLSITAMTRHLDKA